MKKTVKLAGDERLMCRQLATLIGLQDGLGHFINRRLPQTSGHIGVGWPRAVRAAHPAAGRVFSRHPATARAPREIFDEDSYHGVLCLAVFGEHQVHHVVFAVVQNINVNVRQHQSQQLT